MTTTQEAVLQADEARYQALYAQDAVALAPMLHEDYQHIHANGKIDDKAAFLASIRAARYRFVRAERSAQSVRFAGGLALLSGRTHTTIEIDGGIKTMHNAFVTVWLPRDGDLALVHWQATKIVEP